MTGASVLAVMMVGTNLGAIARTWIEQDRKKSMTASDCEVRPLAKNKDGADNGKPVENS